MRYFVDVAKLTNKLMPTYLYGRQINLLVQAMLSPLQSLSNQFVVWAKEKRVEALMTSQIILFEPFLTRKMKMYFLDENDTISISDRTTFGIPLYNEEADVSPNSDFALYQDHEKKNKAPLYFEADQLSRPNCSFTVWSPKINTEKIKESEYLSMLRFWIDKYLVSGKTYKIQYK